MKMTHPDSDQTIEPKNEHAANYASQGWVAVNEDTPAADAPADK